MAKAKESARTAKKDEAKAGREANKSTSHKKAEAKNGRKG